MSVINYGNGQLLSSTAISQKDINSLMQVVTCQALGIVPFNAALVRVDWQTKGQPFGDIKTDTCYLACTTHSGSYSYIREKQVQELADKSLQEVWNYTREWRVQWVLYGPNSVDRARALHSATFMDFFTEALEAKNLFPVSDPPTPTRIPEEINAQWWERADFHLNLYENVTEIVNVGRATSVVINVQDNNNDKATVTVTTK